jgi:hypothetical protein
VRMPRMLLIILARLAHSMAFNLAND